MEASKPKPVARRWACRMRISQSEQPFWSRGRRTHVWAVRCAPPLQVVADESLLTRLCPDDPRLPDARSPDFGIMTI